MATKTEDRKAEVREKNLKAALDVAACGRKVFPAIVTPNAKGKKNVRVPEGSWKKTATSDLGEVKRLWEKHPDAVPCMTTGDDIFVVDLDVSGQKNGIRTYKDLGLDPYDATMVVRSPSGGLHLYFSGGDDLTISQNTAGDGIDTRGAGGFVFAMGAETYAGEYEVLQGDLLDLELNIFARVPDEIERALSKDKAGHSSETPLPGRYQLYELWEALQEISSETDRQPWLEILMAIHHETGGSDAGLALAHAWSARDYAAYEKKEVDAVWRSFKSKIEKPITGDTIMQRAHQERIANMTEDDWDNLDEASRALLGAPSTQSPQITLHTPADCADMTPSEYIIKSLVEPGQIGCIHGDPGAGKSILAPFLGYAVARGDAFFGRTTKQGSVLYVATEDEVGMSRRVAALLKEQGEAESFYVTRGVTDLMNAQVDGQAAPDLNGLLSHVAKIEPSLIIIDTLAMGFPGLEENDAASMNLVVQIGKKLAARGAAVIFVHHGTKAKGDTPRGHSVFNGALDFSIRVSINEQKDVVTGRLSKNRSGPCDQAMVFKIGSVHVGEDIDGEAVYAPICCPFDSFDNDQQPRLKQSEQRALNSLMEEFELGPFFIKAWKQEAIESGTVSKAEQKDSRRKATGNALNALKAKGLLEFDETGKVLRVSNKKPEEFDDDAALDQD